VPLGPTPKEVAVRVHEYAHLTLNRECPAFAEEGREMVASGALDEQWLQGGLDVAVNALAMKRGCPEVCNLPLDNLKEGMPEELQAIWALRKMSTGRTRAGLVKSPGFTLDAGAKEIVAECYRQMAHIGEHAAYASLRAQRACLSTLKSTQDYFRARQELGDPSEAARTGLEDLARQALRALEELVPKRIQNLRESLLGDSEEGNTEVDVDRRSNHWGRLTVKVAELDKAAIWRGPERRPSFMGGFRSAFRLLIPAFDGKAWAIKRKLAGGTILIDGSGSMSIDPDQLKLILQMAPLAQIAIYSGNGSSIAAYGTLWVLARNRRYTSKLPELHGGNVVDGPALRWLLNQKMPRVWICDGLVTGAGDTPAPNLTIEAFRLAKTGGVHQFHSLSSYLEFLKAGGRPAV
jgi:hypothetical protein